MTVNLKYLKKYYNINKQKAAGFLLMMTKLGIDDEFKSVIGTIKRIDENMFYIYPIDSKDLVDFFINEDVKKSKGDLMKELFNGE